MWQDIKMLNALTSALLTLVLLALLAVGLWWLAQRPMFTLRTIRVESMTQEPLRHVNPLTIRAGVMPRMQGNFFTIDLDATRAAFEALPWVRKAVIRREWPDQLIVSIEEHRALGTWGDDGRLLSVKGDVFTANLAEAEDDGILLAFNGPEGSEQEVATHFAQLRHWLTPIAVKPEVVALSNRYAWTVRLDNGITVKLGRAENGTALQERIARLVAVYPQLMERLQGKKIESLDLRYPNGLALKVHGWMPESANEKKTGKKKMSKAG